MKSKETAIKEKLCQNEFIIAYEINQPLGDDGCIYNDVVVLTETEIKTLFSGYPEKPTLRAASDRLHKYLKGAAKSPRANSYYTVSYFQAHDGFSVLLLKKAAFVNFFGHKIRLVSSNVSLHTQLSTHYRKRRGITSLFSKIKKISDVDHMPNQFTVAEERTVTLPPILTSPENVGMTLPPCASILQERAIVDLRTILGSPNRDSFSSPTSPSSEHSEPFSLGSPSQSPTLSPNLPSSSSELPVMFLPSVSSPSPTPTGASEFMPELPSSKPNLEFFFHYKTLNRRLVPKFELDALTIREDGQCKSIIAKHVLLLLCGNYQTITTVILRLAYWNSKLVPDMKIPLRIYPELNLVLVHKEKYYRAFGINHPYSLLPAPELFFLEQHLIGNKDEPDSNLLRDIFSLADNVTTLFLELDLNPFTANQDLHVLSVMSDFRHELNDQNVADPMEIENIEPTPSCKRKPHSVTFFIPEKARRNNEEKSEEMPSRLEFN